MKKKKPLSDNDRKLIRRFYDVLQLIKVKLNDDNGGVLSSVDNEANQVLPSLYDLGRFHGLPKDRLQQESTQFFEEIGYSISHVTSGNSLHQMLIETENMANDGLNEKVRGDFALVDQDKRGEIVALYFAMQSEVKSLNMHGIGLHALLELAKDSDEALFKAVLVDSTVTRLPVIAQRISKAEAFNEMEFLQELAKSITKSKARRHTALDDMRVMIAFVHGFYDLEKITDDDLVNIFQNDLGLIGEEGEDSLDAIKWHVRKWKRSQEGKF